MCFNQAPLPPAPWFRSPHAAIASSLYTHSLGSELRVTMAPGPSTRRIFTFRLGIATAWLGWKRLFHNVVLNCGGVLVVKVFVSQFGLELWQRGWGGSAPRILNCLGPGVSFHGVLAGIESSLSYSR